MAKQKSKSSNVLFSADISDEQVQSMEKAATTQARGQQRRLCLATCARSSDDLRKLLEEAPDAFLDALNMIEAFNTHAKGLAEISETALARMMLVGETYSKAEA